MGLVTQPTALTDYDTRAALGQAPGVEVWNKFGYNEDVDQNEEVIASFGGSFDQRLVNAETLEVESDSTDDATGGTGVVTLIIFGVGGPDDNSRDSIVDQITMNGTTPVTTNLKFWGVNRMTIFQSGSANSNVGTITAKASVSTNTMAEMPAGNGTTQQAIFYIPQGYTFLSSWLRLNAFRSGGGVRIEFRGKVYSELVDSEFEVFREGVDVTDNNTIDLSPGEYFPILGPGPFNKAMANTQTGGSILWFSAFVFGNNTSCRCRFSGKLIKN